MSKEILISIDEFESRAAILESGKLAEIYFGREERTLGSIYKGKVVNILPGMQAAFIDIGLERNAFLCVDDLVNKSKMENETKEEIKAVSIKDALKINQETLVQIIKESMGAKGYRVTAQITLPGRYLVYLPQTQYIGISRRIEDLPEKERLKSIAEEIKPKDAGLIVRTAAEGKNKEDLKKDLEFLKRLWNKILTNAKKNKAPHLIHQELALIYKVIRDFFTDEVEKLLIDSHREYQRILEFLEIISPNLINKVHFYQEKNSLFDAFGVENEIEKALKNKVWLPSGGYIIIDHTEALVAIDVNTGKFIGHNSLNETILKTNLEAAEEIARQIRLRDIGGIIIIDFIDMEKEEDCKELLNNLESAFKKDRTRTNLLGMTELGLVQVTRKKVIKDLNEYLKEPCHYCIGRGKILSIDTLRIKFDRLTKKTCLNTKFETILIKVNPKLALPILGWGGEEIDKLEKLTGKQIYLRAFDKIHQEKIEIYPYSQEDLKKHLEILNLGQEIEVEILEIYGFNLQNGLTFYKGNVIEVLQAGSLAGEQVKIIITSVGHSYYQAQLKE